MISLLSTESLLGIIALLLTILNVNTQLLKSSIDKLEKTQRGFIKYLREDIKIRARLEKKANWIMRKFGKDIEKFNIDATEDLNGDLDIYD